MKITNKKLLQELEKRIKSKEIKLDFYVFQGSYEVHCRGPDYCGGNCLAEFAILDGLSTEGHNLDLDPFISKIDIEKHFREKEKEEKRIEEGDRIKRLQNWEASEFEGKFVVSVYERSPPWTGFLCSFCGHKIAEYFGILDPQTIKKLAQVLKKHKHCEKGINNCDLCYDLRRMDFNEQTEFNKEAIKKNTQYWENFKKNRKKWEEYKKNNPNPDIKGWEKLEFKK